MFLLVAPLTNHMTRTMGYVNTITFEVNSANVVYGLQLHRHCLVRRGPALKGSEERHKSNMLSNERISHSCLRALQLGEQPPD